MMRKIKTKIKQAFSLTTMVAMLLNLVPMITPMAVYAGTLTSVSGTLSNVQTNATANLTLNFTTATTVPVGGKVEISLSSFTWSNTSANLTSLVSSNSDINGTETGSPTFNSSAVVYNYGLLTLPLSGSGLGVGDPVTVVIPNVTNPSWEGNQNVMVKTLDSNGMTIDDGGNYMGATASIGVGVAEVRGQVTAPDGTTPIVNANVNVRSASSSSTSTTGTTGGTPVYSNYSYATTDSQGNFYVFITPMYGTVVNGTYTIDVTAPYNNPDGYTDALSLTSVSVTDGQTNNVGVIRLTQPSVKGKLVKSDGTTPLQWTSVTLHNSNWSVSKWASTDTNGNFSFGGIPAAIGYTVEFSLPWDAKGMVQPANQIINVVSGQVTDLGTISYTTAKKTISGKVLKSNGVAVTNARVNAYKEEGMGWAEATVDSSGNYSMIVGGGTWSVNIYPDWSQGYSSIDWSYNEMPTKVTFSSDNSAIELKPVDFTVAASTVTVSGKVVKPDGAVLSNNGSVNAYSKNGKGSYSQIGADGTFSFKIPAGTYDLRIYTWDDNFGSPSAVTFTVVENQVYNAGTITLLAKNEKIKGTVKDTNGTALANQNINAWRMDGDGWANARSGTDGNYELKVFPGTWMVSMYLDSGMMSGGYSTTTTNYVYNEPPKKIEVATNETKTNVNFAVKIADATISGTVVDSSNNVLSTLYGYAYISTEATDKGYGLMGMGMGAPVTNGQFTLKVPAGTYSVGVNLPPGADYTASSTASVTIVSGETKTASVTALANNATIEGYLKDTAGDVKTGIRAWINADNGNMAYQYTNVDTVTGKYSLKVSPGDWRIGYWVDSRDGYLNRSLGDNKVTAVAEQTVTKDLLLQITDSTISGKVTGPNGSLSWVWVSVDTRSGQKAADDMMTYMYNLGTSTNADGTYTIKVPAGTYYVKAYRPLDDGYINPDEVKVVVDAATPATVNLTFTIPDATITGTTTDSSGAAVNDTLVWAYSDEGAYTQTTSSATGSYTLQVTKDDEWHVGAVKETGATYKKSNEVVVDVPDTTATTTQNLQLTTTGTMPEAVVATFSASNSKTINLDDGTVINVPAGALATSGNVTVTATPKAEVPAQDGSVPISIGYDITATDSNGAEITTTFNSNVIVTLPYTDAQLTATHLNEDDLVPNYWDDTTSTWKQMDNVVLNPDANTISFTTNHFTDFGLLGAADTTAPAAPTNVRVTNPATGGRLDLSWTNPTDTDFSSVNIYRSTTSGALGSKVYSSVTGTSKSDTGLTDGITYYYTIRSVDTVGNESINTVQTNGVPTTAGASTQAPGTSDEPVNAAPGTNTGNTGTGQNQNQSQSQSQNTSYTYFSIHSNGTLITSPNTKSVFLLENGQKRPIVNVAIFEARGYKWENVITVEDSELNLYATGDPINTYPEGTLLKGSDNKIYIIVDGKKRYITGPSIFTSLGYNWLDVVSVTDSHLTLYTNGVDISSTATHVDGALVKATGGSSIFLLQNGKKRGIVSPQIFDAWGYKWNKVIAISQTELDTYANGDLIATYPDGTLLKNNSDSKVYLISGGKKRLIPSPIFFEDMGYKWSSVIGAASSHLDLYTAGAEVKSSKLHLNGTLVKAEGGNSVYLIEAGKKRPISSAAIFETNGYRWSEIVTVKRSELEMYSNGAAVGTYPNGTLLKDPDGKVYVVTNSKISHITNPEVFEKLGYKWNNLISVSSAHIALYSSETSFFNANFRPAGTLIQGLDKTNVYVIETSVVAPGFVKRLITSPIIFERRGYKWSNIVQVSGPELAQYSNGANLNTYPPTSLLKDENDKIYLVSNGKKHWFSGPRAFEDMGYQWSNVIKVTSSELANYTNGNNVQ